MAAIKRQLGGVRNSQENQQEGQHLREEVSRCQGIIRKMEEEGQRAKEAYAAKLLQYKQELEEDKKAQAIRA